MNNRFVFLVLFFLWLPTIIIGQRSTRRVDNMPKFDKRPFHFGFMLGANQMNFSLKTIDELSGFDSIKSIKTRPEFGFDIGIVSSLRITKYLSLRFVPTLSFGNRSVEYEIVLHDTLNVIQEKRIESTYMSFPFYVKYQSRRIGNFRAYVIAGANYSIDLASQEKKKNKEGEAPIKLRRHDYMADVGTGFDFFLPYFKFGIELKMSYGLKNLLVPENSIYTNSVKRLNSKIFQLSFTFEG